MSACGTRSLVSNFPADHVRARLPLRVIFDRSSRFRGEADMSRLSPGNYSRMSDRVSADTAGHFQVSCLPGAYRGRIAMVIHRNHQPRKP
jgi:hypothetical protein